MSKAKKPVRFHFKHHWLTSSERYIYVHDAINNIGKRDFPETWGLGPAWKQLPYYIPRDQEGSENLIKKIEIRNNRRYFKQYPSKFDLKENRMVALQFMRVCRTLIYAVKHESVTSFHSAILHDAARIPRDSLFWIKSWRNICFAGRVRADRGDGVLVFCEVISPLTKSRLTDSVSK